MQIIRKFCVLLAVITTISLSGCQTQEQQPVPAVMGSLEINVIKAGKADAMIVQTQNHSLIIDCGKTDGGSKIVNYLTDNQIEHLDYIVLTHFDKDHIGGFSEVTRHISVDSILVPNYESTKNAYQQYVSAVHENNLPVTVLTEDMSFVLDDCLFEIDPPKKNSYDSENDFSLVLSVTHGENRFLFTGDAKEARTLELLQVFQGEYDFLKLPHHGRYNACTQKLLASVNPQYAVITDSNKNPAEEEVLDMLKQIGCQTYRTKDGSIHISSDGKTITITQ